MTNKCKYLADGVEYYPEDDTILLICCPRCGAENYAMMVTSGICYLCGFDGRTLLNTKQDERKEID